jgi:hypothetical protein
MTNAPPWRAVIPTAAWSIPVAAQNRITRSCALSFVVAFAMATLAGARRYSIHFDLLSSGAQQMKDAGFTLPEGTSPP